ncbi:hypothetical protein NP493_48g00028 [Ridgeia piscesae]|uniref:RBR-type E3 ubiquitin transferase n=1 Tax=Ridgeia piscesae TaxID=27915 RepID=A0AAD9PBS1_RIDPI|nr:hypothetical protein NP493_48g00028 [Ridgeia piscesae]
MAASDTTECCPEPAQTKWTDWQQNADDQRDELVALESILEGTGRFHTLSTPKTDIEVDTSDVYTIQVEVPVNVGESGVRVEAWVPHQHSVNATQHLASRVPTAPKPLFARSESGRRWHSSFLVHHLTPLCLHVTLPHTYPSHSAPLYSLSCLWLDTAELGALCHQLDELYKTNKGLPLIYTWMDWLQTNTLSILGREESVLLTPFEALEEEAQLRDPRALPECSDLQNDLVAILWHDHEQEYLEFAQSSHLCGICFEEKPGHDFFRIDGCQHGFCRDCLSSFCEIHVTEGTVQQLTCPEPKCDTRISAGVVRQALGGESYQRWERLLLQSALDTMSDIEWCPRCNVAVIRDEEETINLAYCTNCHYSFCTQCHHSWHQGIKCEDKTLRLQQMEEDSKSSDVRKQARAKQLKEDYLSEIAVKKFSKPCPHCKTPIEKFDGCNKVRCTRCCHSMCWLCGKEITSYDHFSSTACGMFGAFGQLNLLVNRGVHLLNEAPEGALAVQEALQQNPRANVIVCLRCKQRNLRTQFNNHVKCWQCHANMCYQCRQLIPGKVTAHYAANMPCQQHH